MKRLIAIMMAALTMAAVLSGCGGRMSGNVSTTPNGKVNGGETAITDGTVSSGSQSGNSNSNTNGSGNHTAGSGTGAGVQDRTEANGSAMDDMREAADDMGQAAKDAGRAMGDAITGENGTGMTGGR